MNNTHRSLIGITSAALIGASALLGLLASDGAQAAPEASGATQAAPQVSASTYLVPTSTTAPMTTSSKPRAAKPAAHVQPTTTSSTVVGNLPERLTPEQEALIPDSDEEIQEDDDEWKGCDPDLCEHLPHDYDLPSGSTTTDM